MAIVQTTETYGDQSFSYTYSDAGYMIRQEETGQIYQNAMDILPCPYTYTETDIPIEDDELVTEANIYAEAGRLLLGAD